jgi:hypothetical protein
MSQDKQAERPNLPPWLPVIVNILIAVVVVGAYLYFYISGNVLAWTGSGKEVYPDEMNKFVGLLLTGVGGVVSAVFAVALNLPQSQSLQKLPNRGAYLMTLFRPMPHKEGEGIDWDKVNGTALVVLATILTVAYPILVIWSVVTAFAKEPTTPAFIESFATVGLGVLLGAFGFWFSKLTDE